ncbi:MAG TPA: phospholipase D-like domain-containing protein [Kofleriaceae bacterium]|jgi:phosphatidylserine/phosphatidylglycerophosphate/cardiolipin synthase-like enzyme
MRCFTVVVAVVAACGGGGSGTKTDGGGGGSGDASGPTADADLAGTTDVSIIVEPDGSNAAQLVSAIEAATTSIDMTMYEISDDRIINALTARAKAGVDVQAILDGATGGGAQGGVDNKSFNMDAYTKLNAAGVATVWSSTSFTFTHEKTIIIDNATAWIMTMNATTSAPNSNREYLAIDTDPTDIAEATAIFTADHVMTAITPSGPLVVADTNARSELVALIDTATTSLDVEGEEFSDLNNNGIVQAVANAANRGVTVHVVVANDDPDPTSINRVKLAGAQVVMTGPTSSDGTTSNPYIHAKAIVVDCNGTSCARGFVGSENFSTGSLSYNRELGVIVKAPSELAKVKTAIDTDFAAGVAQ